MQLRININWNFINILYKKIIFDKNQIICQTQEYLIKQNLHRERINYNASNNIFTIEKQR